MHALQWRLYAEYHRVYLHVKFREGRPSIAIKEENLISVRQLTEENRCITFMWRKIEAIGMSQIHNFYINISKETLLLVDSSRTRPELKRNPVEFGQTNDCVFPKGGSYLHDPD